MWALLRLLRRAAGMTCASATELAYVGRVRHARVARLVFTVQLCARLIGMIVYTASRCSALPACLRTSANPRPGSRSILLVLPKKSSLLILPNEHFTCFPDFGRRLANDRLPSTEMLRRR